MVNAGGTLDLNGTVQLVGSLSSTSAAAGAGVTGGTITSGTGSGTLVVETSGGVSYSGSITGTSVNLVRGASAASTLTLLGANTYGGTTVLNSGVGSTGATILKDYGTLSSTSSIALNYGYLSIDNTGLANINDRINDAAGISLKGGTSSITAGRRRSPMKTLVMSRWPKAVRRSPSPPAARASTPRTSSFRT